MSRPHFRFSFLVSILAATLTLLTTAAPAELPRLPEKVSDVISTTTIELPVPSATPGSVMAYLSDPLWDKLAALQALPTTTHADLEALVNGTFLDPSTRFFKPEIDDPTAQDYITCNTHGGSPVYWDVAGVVNGMRNTEGSFIHWGGSCVEYRHLNTAHAGICSWATYLVPWTTYATFSTSILDLCTRWEGGTYRVGGQYIFDERQASYTTIF
ncbi:hypothetical protein L873DRAFT_1802621 [Choiromyces venosus 120613-1]|uniref:Secreted protein n=1 Tax=Choiromyces venosus 120613-1 TaxID=1336337 RepID=A0A3N4K197_9PEZI|nr:hypothetical protein L873DRAFT_1802621 [Choiromyces venosus 120613-1]